MTLFSNEKFITELDSEVVAGSKSEVLEQLNVNNREAS